MIGVATAQPGIFALGTRTHHHLELDVHPAATTEAIADALRALRGPTGTAGGANIVVGFGPELWASLADRWDQPQGFADFARIDGIDGFSAPSTQHDLWIWIHGTGPDLVLDTARFALGVFADVAALALEQPSFVYKDSRDMTGFIDGTANPPIEEARTVACLGDGVPGDGGSFVLAQRWVHDLEAFDALAVADQEAVFGRSKADSVEMDDVAKPTDAHIARVEIDDAHGEERPIFRRSTPFGTVREQGLYFLAFCRDQSTFTAMLHRMFGLAGEGGAADGARDRLLDFSRPVSGSFYFAPSLDALDHVIAAVGTGRGSDA